MIAPATVSQLVTVMRGQAVTGSLVIAERFGKRHADVIRAIATLDCSPEFRRRNFALAEYLDGQGKPRKNFSVSRDGFAFLVMGFTGKSAAMWKEQFLLAFNWQAAEINRLREIHIQPAWQAARLECKAARHGETDVLKIFVDYALAQGSKSASKYYLLITKETNRALFFVNTAIGKGFRGTLTAAQLSSLAVAERIVERALLEAMGRRIFYKEAYRTAVDRVRQFAGFVGQSFPGHSTELLEAS